MFAKCSDSCFECFTNVFSPFIVIIIVDVLHHNNNNNNNNTTTAFIKRFTPKSLSPLQRNYTNTENKTQ